MASHKWIIALVALTSVAAGVGVAHAEDTCATFFWTGAHRESVARYKPHYLVGEGLGDVGMSHIVGARIRHKWSRQTADCFASANSYGYFSHPDFDRTDCDATEACFPGTRRRRMSERLGDVKGVLEGFGIPNADPVYQDSLNRAKTSSYVVVDAMEPAKTSTVSFYGGLLGDYDFMINRLSLVLNLALPPSVRTDVLDEFCSPENVAELAELEEQCFEAGEHCELFFLFETINQCSEYESGAVLDELIGDIAAVRDGLVGERAALAGEREAILLRWAEIQDLRD